MRWLAIVSVLALLCGCAAPVSNVSARQTVLVDPGHGGFDGGTVAMDGTKEKDINLAVSLYLRDILTVCGIPVTLTRDADTATAPNKTEDMKKRLQMYENASAVIAIHQNHFRQSKYNGTQVFYSANHPQSLGLAEDIQESVTSRLQPQNTRKIQKATDGIYLMHHTTVPAVLVECGFLSNPEELEKLKQSQYRQYMAWAISLGYWKYRMES